MSFLPIAPVEAFLRQPPQVFPPPETAVKRCRATSISGVFGVSPGKRKRRLCFQDLEGEFLKIALSFQQEKCTSFVRDRLKIWVCVQGGGQELWINLKSATKRFDLPGDVLCANAHSVARILRLVQEKRLFQLPNFTETSHLLFPSIPFDCMVSFEEMSRIAHAQRIFYRLSKRCYHLANSIDVCPDGFIAIDLRTVIGVGANAQIKLFQTPQGEKIARRTIMFFQGEEVKRLQIRRAVKVFNFFRNQEGLLNTLSCGIYENKFGVYKFVTYHPLYDQNLVCLELKKEVLFRERLKMAKQLLKGLVIIAERGVHRDLSYANILLNTTTCSAVISDFEFFKFDEEGDKAIVNPCGGPEEEGKPREVWDIGNALYYLLKPKGYPSLPWDDCDGPAAWKEKRKTMITQENLERAMESFRFSSELETLMRGMLALNHKERWTAKAALGYLSNYIPLVIR